MEADIHTLYTSGFYRVIDFKCRCTECRTSKPEYSESFSISYVRKGNFLFNVFRHALDSYSGCVLVTKPGFERTVTHTHEVPDECTIFDFRNDFHAALVEQYGNLPFFQNPDLHSTLIRTTPEMELLHHRILRLILTQAGSKLEIDNLVVEVIEKTLERIGDYAPDRRINLRLKKNHLITIETAKAYIAENFINDISLLEIARHCCVSPFHFSRIFKTFTGEPPHRFLLSVRLKNAELLLKNTNLPVADAAFSSGFNSIEYFTSAFRHRYHCPPAAYRKSIPA